VKQPSILSTAVHTDKPGSGPPGHTYKLASALLDQLARAVTPRSPDTPDAWTRVQQRLLTTLQPLFSSSPPPSSASSPLALLHSLLVPASLRRQEASPLAGAIPAAATTLACVLLVLLAVAASAMASSSSSPTSSSSWASRFWGGRFSPFGRSSSSTAAKAAEVKEGDYSYITGEDIARGAADRPDRPQRETDALLLKHRSVSYPVHFPAYSVDDGELTVGKVRAAAAKKLGLPEAEAARVKLFYRGRNLKDDARTARAEGLRSADQPEILVVIGSAVQQAEAQRPPVRGAEELEDDDDDDEDEDDADGKPGKKKRNRKKKNKRGKKAGGPSPATADDARRGPPNPDATFAPVAAPPPPSSSSAPATPQTALQKLDAITASFRAAILPACERFLAAPPPEGERRAAEHRRLTETVLAQVLLKLDAVETDGDDEARARRRELVREAQGLLGRLDGVVGK
jgi:hypothetical protein